MNIYPSGTRIAGQYEVAGLPLIGGMGIVYLCLDHDTNRRPVALKTFKPEYLPDRAARDRFLREGTTWVSLGAHQHIVRCYEIVRVGDGTEVYLALELVAKEQGHEDASLRSWLVPGKPLPLDQALLFALQIARGMKYATEVIPGFVHRDLKPENVLVGADKLTNANVNRLRVTDFGLASVLQEVSGKMQDARSKDTGDATGSNIGRTQLTRGIAGTPLYMAPEQWKGEPVSTATDVYALGCILVEMLTGQRAVEGKSLEALQQAHCSGQVRVLPTSLPESVCELIRRCLAQKPEARLSNWAGVEAVLMTAYAQMCGQVAPAPEASQGLGRAERVAAGWSYSSIGNSYLDIGKADVARDYFEQAAKVGHTENERLLESAALSNLGSVYSQLGNERRAIECYEPALQIVTEIGDRRVEGIILGNLGLAYNYLGDAQRAIGYHEQALGIAREVVDRHGEGVALGYLGRACADIGDTRRAITYYEKALQIAKEIGDRRNGESWLGNLGNAYADLGDTQRAITYYEKALQIAKEIGDRGGEGSWLGNLGGTYFQLGETRRAITCCEQALQIAKEVGDRQNEQNWLGNLGNAYFQLKDVQRAIAYYEQALAIAREVSDRRGEGNALGNLGLAYAALGDARRAIGYYEQALAIDREIGDAMGVASTSFNMALLYVQQGQAARALPLARQAAQIWGQIGSPNAQRAQQLVVQLQGKSR